MRRRTRLADRPRVLLLLAAAIAARCAPTPRTVRHDADLSMLLITIDTRRADAVGAYGNTTAATPWMDRLAGEGVRIERAHAHNVVTLPSDVSGVVPERRAPGTIRESARDG